ncbi:hypothetical protein KY363_08310 [Candidatus Woesearchaeota archaeon]|nr:hypothetical protein [Candidatus Woesearchaeota archaeon]
MKKTILFGMLGLLMLSIFLGGCGEKKDYTEFAKCLTEKGMVMYGSNLCPHCMNMKKEFGNAFTFIKYVECNAQMPGGQPEKCQEEEVEYLPTWKFADGSSLVGELDFSVLAGKTKCTLP